ncbi:MAG: hypothetical protein KIT31_23865, partial [Deltaproteobacteria bacterium]|nr:hypothetical protein [Deltaproteobacteria bacterium]
MRFLWVLALLPACAGRYRTEMVGHGDALVVTRGAEPAPPSTPSAAPGGGGIQLARGSYQFALRFAVPRAQLVEWNVRCSGGGETGGTLGETFDGY